VVDRLGTHEDETLYMYKITRPTPGLTAAQILELAADCVAGGAVFRN
jgi:hypothetical protein